jgi:hypothetical protein
MPTPISALKCPSVAFAGVGGEVGIELALLAIKRLGIAWRIALHRDVGPERGIFRVDLQPFFQARFGVWLNGVGGAFGFAYAAIDTFIGVDDQHILTLIEAIDGADFNAVHILTLDAIFGDDIGHDYPTGLNVVLFNERSFFG